MHTHLSPLLRNVPLPARHGRAKSGPGFSTTWKAPKRPCSSEVGVPGPGGAQPPEGRLSVPFRAKTRPRSPSRGDWSGDRANGATPIPGGFRTEARLSEEEDHSCHQSLYISASKKTPGTTKPRFRPTVRRRHHLSYTPEVRCGSGSGRTSLPVHPPPHPATMVIHPQLGLGQLAA